jgi:hypothetical protein
VGGPAIVFHRYHEAGVTYIREHEMLKIGLKPKLCQKILGYDANALYLWALSQPMPTGYCIRRKRETGFRRDRDIPKGASLACRDWLTWKSHELGVTIQHKFNGREKKIGPYPVDGFDRQNNKIYQFHGCKFHGHVCKLTAGKEMINAAEKRKKTQETKHYLQTLAGYTYEEIYECEWYELKKSNPDIAQHLRKTTKLPLETKMKLTEQDIITAIQTNKLFGVVECDVEVPSHLETYFSEFPPIFKNTEVCPKDAGSFMENFAAANNISSKSRRLLISSMRGKNILLATPLLKWYLDHGLIVTTVHQVVQYRPVACFAQFRDDVSDARRLGDSNPDQAIVAESMKLIGNACYGRTLTNKERHLDIAYCNDAKVTNKVNSTFFRSLNEIKSGCYEVCMSKKKIKLDLPLQIGFFVYQYAKMRMLEFHYDFLLKFVHPSDFVLCGTDTDSAYLAISGYSLDKIIKPDMYDQYIREKNAWFPRTDTPENYAYDKRTPGLFKEEFVGSSLISLSSKTYYAYSDHGPKYSCKGVSHKHSDITKQKYLDVLKTKLTCKGINKGFRLRDNNMNTYVQSKDALSYLYIKRKVLDDGVSTTHLDL